jgi:hypothetical protein
MVEAASGIIPSIERTPWACGEKQHRAFMKKTLLAVAIVALGTP